jgi:hypothetical protein
MAALGLAVLFLCVPSPKGQYETPTAQSGTIRGIPIQDTTGNIVDNYIIKYNAATGLLEWEVDAGAGGADADSLKGAALQDTTGNLADNDVMSYDKATNTWLYEAPSGAGLWNESNDSTWLVDAADDDTTLVVTDDDTGVVTLAPGADQGTLTINSITRLDALANSEMRFVVAAESLAVNAQGLTFLGDSKQINEVLLINAGATLTISTTSGDLTLNSGDDLVLMDSTFLGAQDPDSLVRTGYWVQSEIGDTATARLASYSLTSAIVLRDGTQALLADWGAGDFDITGLERVEADTFDVTVQLNVGDGSASGEIAFAGATSGSASMGVRAIAGTPAKLLLPLTDGTSGQVLGSDGGVGEDSLAWTSIDSAVIATGALSFSDDLRTFTEAELQTQLSDVTDVYTNNDGSPLWADGTQALTANWAAGDFDITTLEALEADTVIATVQAILYGFQLRVNGILYTYDSTDIPVDGDVLTLNTAGTTIDWQPDNTGGAGSAAHQADTSGANNNVILDSIHWEQSGNIDIRVNRTSEWDTVVFSLEPAIDVDSIHASLADIDTVETGGDLIVEFAGTGLTVTSNILNVDLGTAIEAGEISLLEFFAKMDRNYFDTAADAGGDSIIVIYADSATNLTDNTVDENDIDWGSGAGQVSVVDVPATAWRVFYSNGSGVTTELALGADGTYLESNGAAAAPTFTTPSGSAVWTEVFDSGMVIWVDDATPRIGHWYAGPDVSGLVIGEDADSVRIGPVGLTVADSIDIILAYIDDFVLYTGGGNNAAYDTTDAPTNGQQLTWGTGNVLTWEAAGSGISDLVTLFAYFDRSYFDTAADAGGDSITIKDDGHAHTTTSISGLLDADMANNALDADKIVGDATDDDDLDVAAGGTGLSTLPANEILMGNAGGDILSLAPATTEIIIGDGVGAPTLAALSGDATMTNGGVVTVVDDLHDHVITNIDAFTETELETQLSDVTALFTNNVTGDVTVSGGTATIGANIVDSANVADGDLSEDDINWGYEWIYLDLVHGFGRALSDSIYLSFPMQSANGDTLFLLRDSAGNITPGDQDTVNVSGFVPYACTIDSVEVKYMITTGSEIVDGWLRGPDLSSPTNLCDSIYETFATDLTSTSWDTAQYAITDITASGGERFSYKYIVQLDTDNDALRIGWIRLRVRR